MWVRVPPSALYKRPALRAGFFVSWGELAIRPTRCASFPGSRDWRRQVFLRPFGGSGLIMPATHWRRRNGRLQFDGTIPGSWRLSLRLAGEWIGVEHPAG